MDFIRAALALIVTLALLGGLAYLAMRFDFAALFNGDPKAKRKKLSELKLADFLAPRADAPRRLQIVEQRILDARMRLMIVRWDDEEHLLLVGGGGDSRIASKPAAPKPATPPAANAEGAA
ncbi:MAG: hypothetical protein ABWZ40_01380 [Caulobacterales bacterium]